MSAKNRIELLKKLQHARQNKSSKSLYEEDETDDKVYDLIDEEEFRSMKRQELLRDDFVVDDDGLGYVDRGVDEWDDRNRDQNYSSEEDDKPRERAAKGSKKIKNDGKGVKSSSGASIGDIIAAQHTKNAKVLSKAPKKFSLDEFDDILQEFDGNEASTAVGGLFGAKSHRVVPKLENNIKREANAAATPPTIKRMKIDEQSFSTPQGGANTSPLAGTKTKANLLDDRDLQAMIDDVQSSPTITKERSADIVKSGGQSSEEDSDEEITFRRRTIRSAAASQRSNVDIRSSVQSSPFVTAPPTPSGSSKLKEENPKSLSFIGKRYSRSDVISDNASSFKFYWLDFAEVDSTLLLFGKISTRENKLISAMIQILNLSRELFFLPREGKTASDVHGEIIPLLMEKYGLENIRAKPEIKKYAFELPGIPHESEYLKVLLPYRTPKNRNVTIPSDLEGDTFHHVFGGNTNIFESFVVQKKVMGPCWLEINNGDFSALSNASHCDIEVQVSQPSSIEPTSDKHVPNLNCASLAVQTIMSSKENKQEIVSITLSQYKNLAQDLPIPEDLAPNDTITLVRPPVGSSFPTGLTHLAKKNLTGNLRLFNNEKALLSCFCAMMKSSDPDVIIGHRLENVALDTILYRCFELKIPTFSCLGRRARKSWPDKFGKNPSMNQFYNRDILSGRLLCDISNEMGQSLTPKCQSWDLPEMYQVTCQKEQRALEINYQNPQYQNDVNSMIMALQENVSNALISAEIAFRIQILSLTKQLTVLAGNAWCQTLGGTRAGRNEYILLHEFERNNYIVPDKETKSMRNQRQQRAREEAGLDGGDEVQVSSKKAKYQGGLVFEPEKGLHKNYVLVMDFNSLYPSIIQEYNICFTTVERDPSNIDELPNVPSSEMAQGVLPRLLASLVQKRREVKKLLKTEPDPHKRTQCDIRQQALKLTANSMYGCLGYVNSRFYAKPLAMLVTNKGREILMNTRQLAESLALTVVYGDTDSVMIDTGSDSYMEAIKIGENFKKLVNERYRLLEIDTDNVFRKLLLHAKKKYAALTVVFDKSGAEKTLLEVKGLDMRRREYCPLSKEVSTHVLETILSDKEPETALQDVYEYLEDIREKVENNTIRVDKYKINTRLSKDPKAYPGGKNMPAVQAALRMREAGRVVKAGSVITFVITKQEGVEDDSSLSPAERARVLNEVMVKNNNLRPDPQFYLEKQIFAPVERLLERIESFDIVRLSESLGLDSRRFINRAGANGELNGSSSGSLQPLESSISDEERFKDVAALTFQCSGCQQRFPFGGIVASKRYQMSYSGLQCSSCQHTFAPLQMSAQLESAIRSHISMYYAGYLACDDPTCGNNTRQVSVFGKRCLNENCMGVMRYRYTDKQLYNQLLYFESLFDVDKNKKDAVKPLYKPDHPDAPEAKIPTSQLLALGEQNRELFQVMSSVVQKYLANCARRFVDMDAIFAV
ncbi:DNA-directed DNA polymerase alpha catalytic subunit POL1 [Lachancea thermotolerans CBS 6340]|uniref:DNA polymerase n=1 Tax=Lachancea thermotolerans (strain ATCC 56472 / CBS 6340 / NRRL Y-8284) TaxID=559295 RepID=C5DGX5_LACTC|nr:KLTH0D09064p [Lachancea thermotolerans CBS 6340]CAR22667.1 KLTH0D09064p [Lachancea thermotolerans CBS 6340]